jgi:hypothetical protein
MMNFPRGVDVLIKKAAVDADFRQVLLKERDGAADRIGLVLEPGEIEILRAIPAKQLEAVVTSTKVPSGMLKAFRGYAAAAMLAIQGCIPVAGGARPDTPGTGPNDREEFPPTIDSPPTAETASTAAAAGTAGAAATAIDTQPIRGVRADDPIPKDTSTTGIRPDVPKGK